VTDTPDTPQPEPEHPDGADEPSVEQQIDAILGDSGAEEAFAELDRKAGADIADQTQDGGKKSQAKKGKGATAAGEANKSQATLLVELARRQYRTVLGSDGKTYAVPLTGAHVALPLRGENGLRIRLSIAYFNDTGAAASSSALADALTALEVQAMDTTPEPVALRVARHDGNLILDLGTPDGRCVVIAPGEWHVEPESPVLFRRTALISPLPIPSRENGGLDRLRALLNVSESGFRLLTAWLIAALFPDIPHPILAITGEQGTAKSTCGRLLVTLIDPSPAPLRAEPKDADAWRVQASAGWTVMLDNLSTIQPWFSDTLCKAVTGDGMVKRALYTDDDVSVFSFRRVIGMTAIDAGALRGDLAERLLPIELDPIPPDQRRTDDEVNQEFAAAQAAVLGALLDLAANVLTLLSKVRVERLPRLADFAKILAALDKATGWTTLADYFALADEITETVIEADPFADAVRALITKEHEWTGTAAGLLELLTPADNVPKAFPRTARAVAGHLRRVAPALRKTGIAITFERDTKARTIRMTGRPD
jgi:hypothetical protein